MNLALVTGAAALAVVLVQSVTFLIARRVGRYNVVDIAWGIGFVAVAAVAALLGSGDLFRRILVLVLTAMWGLRLAGFLYVRSRGKGEDPRYRDLLQGDFSVRTVVRKVFAVQAAATWFVSLPLQLSAVLESTPTVLLPVMALGVVVWAIGLTFEAVGDYQMRVFKSDPSNRGAIMDSGLWAWTRHPNYFGDAAVWWGLWLVTIAGWISLVTVLSPVLMTYLLVYVTGGRLTEKYMKHRPGFADYCSRTSFFVPRTPKVRRG